MAEFLEGIEGYNEVEITEIGSKPKDIEPGAYVLKIKAAKLERYTKNGGGMAIRLAFDIVEGEFSGYYQALYDYNKSGQYAESAKWKGTFSIWVPVKKDDQEQYKKDVASFKRAITAINDSNPGKPIDPSKKLSLDEFKGKLVGGAFGLVDWEYNGKEGTRCECRWLVGVDRVHAGSVDTPKHKGIRGAEPKAYTAAASTGSAADDLSVVEILSDDEVPF